jgi:hypothetical protein
LTCRYAHSVFIFFVFSSVFSQKNVQFQKLHSLPESHTSQPRYLIPFRRFGITQPAPVARCEGRLAPRRPRRLINAQPLVTLDRRSGNEVFLYISSVNSSSDETVCNPRAVLSREAGRSTQCDFEVRIFSGQFRPCGDATSFLKRLTSIC